jgi:hypothetical protein
MTVHVASTYTVADVASYYALRLKFPFEYAASHTYGCAGFSVGYCNDGGALDAVTDVTQANWLMVDQYVTGVRVVGAGLKVKVISGGDNLCGILQGGLQATPLKTVNVNWSDIENALPDPIYSAEEGITVRWIPSGASDYEFRPLVGFDELQPYDSPSVVFSGGITDGTTISVEAIMHLEYTMTVDYMPGSAMSPISLEWQMIKALVSDPELQPYVTKGHSFRDLFRTAAARSREIAKIVDKYGPKVVGFARALSNVLALLA